MANTYSHNVEWEKMEQRRQAARLRYGERNRITAPSSARLLMSAPLNRPRPSAYSERCESPPPPSSVGGLLQVSNDRTLNMRLYEGLFYFCFLVGFCGVHF